MAGTHPRTSALQLIETVVDPGSWRRWDEPVDITTDDPAYRADLERARERTGLDESVITGEGRIEGRRVAIVACEFRFLAGSIGVASGERLVRAVERATAERLPLLAAPASGGTRMQEGTVAFLQMVKVAAAITDHKAAGLPYLVHLRHPTTGGVLASWGSLGHVTAAEPGALIGFLGPRVHEALYGEEFPAGVQVAENLMAHGLVDAVLPPERLSEVAARVLRVLCGDAAAVANGNGAVPAAGPSGPAAGTPPEPGAVSGGGRAAVGAPEESPTEPAVGRELGAEAGRPTEVGDQADRALEPEARPDTSPGAADGYGPDAAVVVSGEGPRTGVGPAADGPAAAGGGGPSASSPGAGAGGRAGGGGPGLDAAPASTGRGESPTGPGHNAAAPSAAADGGAATPAGAAADGGAGADGAAVDLGGAGAVPGRGGPSAEESIRRSRRAERPGVRDLLRAAAEDVSPLSGTGAGEHDPGLLLALARVGGTPCVVLGHDRAARHGDAAADGPGGGQPLGPAGLRTARRGMRIAAELGLPLLTVVDTAGAALNREAEEGGLAGEIARCLADMATLPAPTLCLLLGQGAGGAALALLPADRVLAARHAWLSPLPPEGASAILYRTTERAYEIADRQGVRSADLLAHGIVDRIVEEGAGDAYDSFLARLGDTLGVELAALRAQDQDERLAARRARHRRIGLPG
ncbi:carboxyl transferase domain-containing protein [Streptomyces sp. ME19-01-6]|uniref:carboxyl transferase domain-containing protein n=1 Tax=Streptomyces sp. ME19-01-6 TaxID=3028686 RepID=UPI0029B202E7|nr:carboxyl transferase domain-containing protein [Streptomyces sp. ME19-01-6]MDX3231530.1 carboxyl transferase domain-containing protein [Streptomyces sp. ME19-01-6]